MNNNKFEKFDELKKLIYIELITRAFPRKSSLLL